MSSADSSSSSDVDMAGDVDPQPQGSRAAAGGKPRKCRFNDCDNMAVDGTSKCAFHKNRRQCCVENCTNQVYARKLCVRHGGKKQCQADNCEAHARGGGFCLQHGGFVVKRFCIVEGCSKQAHARQKCVRHGGGRRCKVDGCMQHARAGGLCNRHSHGHECRIEGCNKTAQHSGSICFRHAMELRAHGQEVPELNISKGGRLSSKKRQQLQREQQLKQEQFHHHQIQQQQQQLHHMQQQQQQQHHLQHVAQHHPQQLGHHHPMGMQQQQQQMMMQQAPPSHMMHHHQAPPTAPASSQHMSMASAASTATTAATSASASSSSSSNPFGLPLKINVPTTMPKFSLRTPLGTNSFPTPRSHEFSLLMGLPSPQIDTSQLPSVLAMTNAANAQRGGGAGGGSTATGSAFEPTTPLTASFLANGPPSISRGGRNSYLSLGLFPTPTSEKIGGHDEDLDAIISNYSKFMATPTADSASPLAYSHSGGNQYAPHMLENIGVSVFEHGTSVPTTPATRSQLAAVAAAAAAAASGVGSASTSVSSSASTLQRLKMDFLSPVGSGSHGFEGGFPSSSGGGNSENNGASANAAPDYTAQFFADAKSDKGRVKSATPVPVAAAPPAPKAAGVTAA